MSKDSVGWEGYITAEDKKPVPFEQELIEVLTDISIQINVLPDKLADAMEYRLRDMARETANGEDEEYDDDDEDNKEKKKNGWDL